MLILINDEKKFGGFGVIKYKDKPMFDFATDLSIGYGGQYYVIRKLELDIAYALFFITTYKEIYIHFLQF